MSQHYIVVAGDFYYPSGGWDDYIGWYTDMFRAEQECFHQLSNCGKDWAAIVEFDGKEYAEIRYMTKDIVKD